MQDIIGIAIADMTVCYDAEITAVKTTKLQFNKKVINSQNSLLI
jgi:hypothetical protein